MKVRKIFSKISIYSAFYDVSGIFLKILFNKNYNLKSKNKYCSKKAIDFKKKSIAFYFPHIRLLRTNMLEWLCKKY